MMPAFFVKYGALHSPPVFGTNKQSSHHPRKVHSFSRRYASLSLQRPSTKLAVALTALVIELLQEGSTGQCHRAQ